jgi:hypothetical protein
MGNHFEMTSKTENEGFSVDLKLQQWVAKDDKLDDWKIPLTFVPGSASRNDAGTTIVVSELRREVKMRLNDGSFSNKLHSTISQSYSLFLNQYVRVFVNDEPVEPFRICLTLSIKTATQCLPWGA